MQSYLIEGAITEAGKSEGYSKYFGKASPNNRNLFEKQENTNEQKK